MSYNVLISGFGSIGKKHANIIKSNFKNSKIKIFSKKKNNIYNNIFLKEDLILFNPDYIIISTYTSTHYEQLVLLNKLFSNKKILVEKPLFDHLTKNKLSLKNKVFVNYNLRQHPLIQLIKKLTLKKEIWNYQVFCGSYLPDWREGNYKNKSSSYKKYGGGVLLDLSHEIDYTRMILGNISLRSVIFKKISNLAIQSNDLLLLNGYNKKTNIHISLNYFSKYNLRQILIDGKGISICANLNHNKAEIFYNGKKLPYKNKFNIFNTYLLMHKEIISGSYKNCCTFLEALKTQKLLDKILLKSK